MLKLAIAQPSLSNWVSPLHIVLKKTSGDWHPCGYNRAPNKITNHDCYPVPHIQDFSSSLHGCSFLKTLSGESMSPDPSDCMRNLGIGGVNAVCLGKN